jgi:hypothetical protein
MAVRCNEAAGAVNAELDEVRLEEHFAADENRPNAHPIGRERGFHAVGRHQVPPRERHGVARGELVKREDKLDRLHTRTTQTQARQVRWSP